MSSLKKVFAIVLGDVYGKCGTAALAIASTYKHIEILLVDDNLDNIQRAYPVFSGLSRCSYIHTDIRTVEGTNQVIEEITKAGHWVQYLFNGYGNFDPFCQDDDSFHVDDKVNYATLNKAVHDITQAALDNMIRYTNGKICNVATSPSSAYLVKLYGENTYLDHHPHPNGEIIMVLEGDYSDEDGHSFAGEYLRNPPNSEHTPYSNSGAVIMVLFHDIPEHDQAKLRIDLYKGSWFTPCEGVKIKPIHHFGKEYAAFVHYSQENEFKPWLHFHGANIMTLPNNLMKDAEAGSELGSLVLIQTSDYAYDQTCFSQVLAECYGAK